MCWIIKFFISINYIYFSVWLSNELYLKIIMNDEKWNKNEYYYIIINEIMENYNELYEIK